MKRILQAYLVVVALIAAFFAGGLVATHQIQVATAPAAKAAPKFRPRAIVLGSTTLKYSTQYQAVVYLASLTNITPPGNPINENGIGDPNNTPSFTFLQVDREVMQVLQLNTPSSSVLVNRGYLDTAAVPHLAGATVYFGPPQDFPAWGELRRKQKQPVQVVEHLLERRTDVALLNFFH